MLGGLLEFSVKILSDKAHGFLDVFGDGHIEGFISSEVLMLVTEQTVYVISQVFSTKIDRLDGVRNGITFVNWNCMSDTLA